MSIGIVLGLLKDYWPFAVIAALLATIFVLDKQILVKELEIVQLSSSIDIQNVYVSRLAEQTAMLQDEFDRSRRYYVDLVEENRDNYESLMLNIEAEMPNDCEAINQWLILNK